MNLKEKKAMLHDIMKQLEEELETKNIPKEKVYKACIEEAETDNASELIAELLAVGYIYRSAPGMFALAKKNPQTKAVKVIVVVERDGKEIKRVRYDEWLDSLTIEEIVETIDDAIGSIDEV